MQDIILASSSPHRRAILDKIHLTYHSISPKIDEKRQGTETAEQLVLRLCLAKAQKVASQNPNSLVIGADQVALLGDIMLGKPLNTQRAEQQLTDCSGKKVSFYNGVCLYDSSDLSYQLECVIFNVYFRVLSSAEIKSYIALEKPLDCAGSFKAEGLGISLFEKLEGDDFNALIGLPVIRLLAMLREKGVSPLL